MTKEGPEALCDVGGIGSGRRRQQRQALVKLACPVHQVLDCRSPHRDIQGAGILEWLDIECACMACKKLSDDSNLA